MGALTRIVDFIRGTGQTGQEPATVSLTAGAYLRNVQDLQQRLSLQTLTPEMFVTAQNAMNYGNPAAMARINDAMLQTDPEIRAAVKQLKTAIGGVEFVVTAPNDSDRAKMISEDIRLSIADPDLNVRQLKGWVVEHRLRGGGLIETIWNEPTEPTREWERFVVVPQQRMRFNRITGEPQFAGDPFMFQGTDVSKYEKGKWIVVAPDLNVADFTLRGTVPALLNDWFGRLNVMGWWNQSLERDAMKTLIGKAGSDADATALDFAFKNRGAAGAFLIRDPNSSITALEGTYARSGTSPYGEFMTHTAQRMFLAILGESQTGIIEKNAGSKQSMDAQYKVAKWVIEDLCADISEIAERDLFTPYVLLNYGEGDIENVPSWEPKLGEPIDIVELNQAIATRPANVKLGTNWYRKETQWPAPLPDDEPLDPPMPLPGQFPAGGAKPTGQMPQPGMRPPVKPPAEGQP